MIKKLLLSSLFVGIFSCFTIAQTTTETPTVEDEKTTSTEDDDASESDGDKSMGGVFDGMSITLSAGMNVYFGDIAAYKLFPRPSQFNEHITAGFKATIAREIKWGLGAQINYQRGSLIGTRQPGKQSSFVSFENQFFDLSFQVRYFLNKALFKKNEYNRFYLYAQVGVGTMWYRSRLYDTKTFGTKDYEGWVEVEATEDLAQKTLSDKVARAKTFTIPYGLTVNYKFNYKIDIHLDITQTSTFTDRIDAFRRDWTAYDKYSYIGLGLTYNFNRTADDAPKKREKTKKKDKEKATSSNDENIKQSLLSKKSDKKSKKNNEDDELLNIRLKLFETQLKLFEMQYLLGQ